MSRRATSPQQVPAASQLSLFDASPSVADAAVGDPVFPEEAATDLAPAHRLLRASAGTGKTYRLVQAYAEAVLDQGHDPTSVVALTFTRKAAAEMRTRIRAHLRAGGAGPETLAALARAPISNFHGLALQLLRRWDADPALSDAGEILAEGGQDARLFVTACEQAWLHSQASPAVQAAVTQLAHHFAVTEALPVALWDAISRLREDGRPVNRQAWHQDDLQAALTTCETELAALVQRLDAAKEDQTAAGRRKIDGFVQATAGLQAPPSVQQEATSSSIAADAERVLNTWVQAACDAAQTHLDRKGKLGQVYTPDDQALFKERLPALRAAALCARLRSPMALLLDVAWQRYRALKRGRNAADFGDLVEGLVRHLETDPEAWRELRQTYRTVLVDEAQDTNPLQRRLVHLLAGFAGPAEAAADSAANSVKARGSVARLFVVGDWKQSIYTFRGAHPESFARFAADVRDRGGVEEQLAVSRRSTADLVAGINSIGRHVLGDAYEALEPLSQDRPSSSTAPEAPLLWLDTTPVPPTPDDGDPVQAEAQAQAAWLAQAMAAGQPAGDFAILLATMTQAPVFGAALAKHGIPYVLAGGGGFYQQSEIVDILHLMQWCAQPGDMLAAGTALRSAYVGLSDDAISTLLERAPGGGRHLSRLLAGHESATATAPAAAMFSSEADGRAWQIFNTAWRRLHPAITAMPALQWLQLANQLLHTRAIALAQPAGEQRAANLEALESKAKSWDLAGRGTAAAFAHEHHERVWADHRESMAAVPPAQRGAVRVMTVHQSKGLQFPVVLLPDLGRRGRNDDMACVRYDRQVGLLFRPQQAGKTAATLAWREASQRAYEAAVAEQRRLLYVAITRAERQLVLVGPWEQSKPARHGFRGLLANWLPAAQRSGELHLVTAAQALGNAARRGECDVDAAASSEMAAPDWRGQWASSGETPPLPDGTLIQIPVTTLQDYDVCPRRGTLRHVLRLTEVLPSVAVRGAGKVGGSASVGPSDPMPSAIETGILAHRVLASLAGKRLASESGAEASMLTELAGHMELVDTMRTFFATPWAQEVLGGVPQQRQHELPFKLKLPAGKLQIWVSGQIDLLYEDRNGPVVVDFKYARAATQPAELARYRLQLDLYALAVARLLGLQNTAIRTQLVFLRDPERPPVQRWVSPQQQAETAARVGYLGRLVATDPDMPSPYSGVLRKQCVAAKCGYLGLCHP